MCRGRRRAAHAGLAGLENAEITLDARHAAGLDDHGRPAAAARLLDASGQRRAVGVPTAGSRVNPATLVNRPALDGTVTGTRRSIFRRRLGADHAGRAERPGRGRARELHHRWSGHRHGQRQRQHAAEVADLQALQVSGPDLKVDASGRVALDRTSASNLKYHVEAIDVGALGRLAGRKDLAGSAVLDGAVTGNAASLQTTGTLDGSNLGLRRESRARRQQQHSVALPDLDVKKVRVEADTSATFIKAGALQLNAVTAKTTYAGDRLQFTTSIKEQQRELDATGELILHPDHQEVHLPQLAVRTQGVEWRTVRGEATVKYGRDRIELDNVRLQSADQSLTVNGRSR